MNFIWRPSRHQPAPPALPALSPPAGAVKQLALSYVEATLTVLQREAIPLAAPVHGRPARGARFIQIPIHLDRRRVGPLSMRKVLADSTLKAIQAAARVDGVLAWQERDRIVFQYQLDRSLWQFYHRADLPAPDGIGLAAGRQLVRFSLEQASHTLVAGMTRSGKSVAVESILFALMAAYPRDRLGLVVVDTNRTLGTRKSGLSVTEIGQLTNAAHLLRPVAVTAEAAASAIDFVYRLLLERKAASSQGERGVVLVIDELMDQAVVGDRDSGAYHESHLAKLSQIASLGLKFNLFLVLGAQDPKIGNLSGLLLRNIGRRLVGRVADSIASRVLAGREGIGCHRLTDQGDFVQVAGETVERFQVAEPTRADYDRLERAPTEPVEEVEPAELQELDDSLLAPPEPDRGGNVEIPVDPYTLALYFHDRQLSIAQAREHYHLSRTVHTRHRDFARELAAEIRRLAEGHSSRSPHYLTQEGEQQ